MRPYSGVIQQFTAGIFFNSGPVLCRNNFLDVHLIYAQVVRCLNIPKPLPFYLSCQLDGWQQVTKGREMTVICT